MEIVNIYEGEALNIWHDGELAFVEIYPNAITFMVPLEYLGELFAEFAHAQANFQIQEASKN